MNNVSFRLVEYNSPEYTKAVELREEILREPLGLRFSPEQLKAEEKLIHIVGVINHEIISTAILVPEDNTLKMRQVAVKSTLQRHGIGSQMVKFCESYALEQGIKSIYCHARAEAVCFYERHGYVPEGDYFIEVNIRHLKMKKDLQS